MTFEARYKIGKEVIGPRSFEEVRREIRSGVLPADTPLQLAVDGLWTDIEGAEKKVVALREPILPRSPALRFIAANVLIAVVGYFWPVVCLVAAGLQYLLGVIANYFEEGRKRPAVAFATLVTMMFPLFVIVGSGERAKPHVLWLVGSGFLQLALFLVFIQFRFT